MKKHSFKIKNCQRGMSMVEIVLVIGVVIFIFLLINSLPGSISIIGRSKHTSIAKDVASKEIEYLRQQTYANLSVGSGTFTDANLQNLPNSSATYDIENCPAIICTGGEKVKQVSVTVSWLESGNTKQVKLNTLVAQGGVGQ